MQSETLWMIWIFLLGACIGSFLNVCIYRMPRDLSIIAPGSHCPCCHTPLRWYDNIPVLSYLVLGGKCRYCLCAISPRYAFVEALTGLLFVGLYYRYCVAPHQFGTPWAMPAPRSVFAVYAALASALVASTFIDFDFRIIPNEITFTGIALGPVLSFLAPAIHSESASRGQAVLLSLLGITVGGGVVYGIGLLGKVAFRKEAMGLGDVKLMALVGGVTGWQVAVIAFFVAPFFGLLMGIPNLVLKGKHVIPYGPFLSIATLVVLCWKSVFVHFLTVRLGL